MNFDIVTTLKTIPAAIIGLTVHEYSHALMGYKLGDSTPSPISAGPISVCR